MVPINASHHDGAILCGAVFLLCDVLWSLATGSALLFHRTVKRSEDGLQYWTGVLMTLAGGIALIIVVFTDWYHRMAGR